MTSGTRYQARPLGEFEQVWAQMHISFRYGMRAEGALDLVALQAAFTELVRRNPVLAAHLEETADGFMLVPSGRELCIEVRQGDPDAFQDSADEPLDQTQQLVRLQVIQRGDDAMVVGTLHHSIADGNAAFALLAELWANYTAIVSGAAPGHFEPRPIPIGPHNVLDLADAPPMGPPGGPEFFSPATFLNGKGGGCRRSLLVLSPAHTSAVARFAKARNSTVHAVLAGAVLAAERTMIDEPGALPVLVRSSVDVRGLLPTPIEVLDGTNFVGMVLTALHVDLDDDPMTLGTKVVDDIRAGIADGSALYSSMQPLPAPEIMDNLPPVTYISNVGRIPLFVTPDSLRVTAIRMGILPLGSNSTMYMVSTYNGELTIDVITPIDGISEAGHERLFAAVRDQLADITDSDPTTTD